MAVEIELKARLDDYAPVKERLSLVGDYCCSYKKSDSYWLPAQPAAGISVPASGVRVRRESGIDAAGAAHESVLATYKIKEISGGIEVNNECEFTVSDAGLFEALLGRLGLRRAVRKEKEGWAWTIPPQDSGQSPILAELSQVAGLGWFLEIEIMAADDCEQIVEESRRRLFALLEKLEIPAEWIETRPYTVMLREKEEE
ncbi:MAG: class IV adenylate cyclase [Treponema sp.]|jgi:predicted adenylyl cyclase CyaB|nr:class IV adenylate cyclase [Treponema sp.]